MASAQTESVSYLLPMPGPDNSSYDIFGQVPGEEWVTRSTSGAPRVRIAYGRRPLGRPASCRAPKSMTSEESSAAPRANAATPHVRRAQLHRTDGTSASASDRHQSSRQSVADRFALIRWKATKRPNSED